MDESFRRILRPREAAAILGVSKPTLYRLAAAGRIPQRVKVGPNCSGWVSDELFEFVAGLPRVGPEEDPSARESNPEATHDHSRSTAGS